MNEALFDVVFKGKFVSQIDKQKAIVHFSKIFKMSVEKAQLFFDGKPRILKKSLNLEKASSFRASLKKAGLRVSLDKKDSQDSQKESEPHDQLTLSEVGVVIVNKPFVQPKHFNTEQFSLDEVGVEIVHKEPVEALEFDLSELVMDEVGVDIVEKTKVPEPDIDISDISVDEVGSTFAEKPDLPEPEFDLSELDLDEIGATFAEKKKIPEPDINIDGIEIVD